MENERELLKGSTPTLVMAVLRDTPLHGYAIAREIERRSGNSLKCKEGTLYPALHALEKQGLIQGEWRREANGRERKVYSLTPAGHGALEERAQTWARFAAAVQNVIAGGEDEPETGPAGDSRDPQRDRGGSIPRTGRPEPAF